MGVDVHNGFERFIATAERELQSGNNEAAQAAAAIAQAMSTMALVYKSA